MKVSKAATRYAKALLELAEEKSVQDQVLADMALVAQTLEASKDLAMLVESKVVSNDQKLKAFTTIFKDQLQEMTFEFFALLTKNERADIIPDISVEYPRLYKLDKRILDIEVRTASKLSAEALNKIKTIMSEGWNSVEVTEVIDPSLIGGFVVKGNHTVYDASVASQLREISNEIVDYSHIAQL